MGSVKHNWDIETLGDVCDLQNGYAFKSKSYVDSSNTLNIRMSNIRPDGSFNPEHNIRYLPDSFSDDYQQFLLKEGDLVIAMTDMAGDPKILGLPTMVKNLKGRKFLLNQRVGKLMDFSENLHIPYLTYYLSSPKIKKYYKSKGAGGLQLNISKKDILTAQIPIPPLTEQKQIVALLDQAFKAINQAQQNIEKNIANAKELFQSKLNAIFSQTGEGWEERTLGKITSKIGSGSTPRGGQASYKESGISLIRSMNVHDEGFTDKKLAFIDDEQATKLNNVTIQENDVLLNITGASVARCCVVDSNYLPARVNQHVSIIRIKDNEVHHQFLHYALTSKANKDLLLGIGEQGSTRQAITKVQIENFTIRYPSEANEQKSIIESLNELKSRTTEFESTYQIKLNNLEELKRSILQKAFDGELT